MRCPQCSSQRIHISRRSGLFERFILPFLLIRPFRCEWCDCRFFRWSSAANPNASRAATN
jgi:predicted Zn-ribbon and HTH transcriptional regulator